MESTKKLPQMSSHRKKSTNPAQKPKEGRRAIRIELVFTIAYLYNYHVSTTIWQAEGGSLADFFHHRQFYTAAEWTS